MAAALTDKGRRGFGPAFFMGNKPGYHERAKSQSLSWAIGKPYHNKTDDECCPDFSCCCPDLFEQDQAKRWRCHNAAYGPKAVDNAAP